MRLPFVDCDVSADGMGVTRFRATNIPGDTCTFGEIEVNFTTPVPIENHSFSRQVSNGLSFDGTFPSPGSAQGTLKAHQNAIPFVQPACDSGVIPWSATTSAQPTPSPSASPTPTPTDTPTATPTATPTPTSTGSVLKGDANCDGHVDIGDVETMLRDQGGVLETLNEQCQPDLDLDCGGTVDPIDILALLWHAGDMDWPLPVGCPPIGSQLS